MSCFIVRTHAIILQNRCTNKPTTSRPTTNRPTTNRPTRTTCRRWEWFRHPTRARLFPRSPASGAHRTLSLASWLCVTSSYPRGWRRPSPARTPTDGSRACAACRTLVSATCCLVSLPAYSLGWRRCSRIARGWVKGDPILVFDVQGTSPLYSICRLNLNAYFDLWID